MLKQYFTDSLISDNEIIERVARQLSEGKIDDNVLLITDNDVINNKKSINVVVLGETPKANVLQSLQSRLKSLNNITIRQISLSDNPRPKGTRRDRLCKQTRHITEFERGNIITRITDNNDKFTGKTFIVSTYEKLGERLQFCAYCRGICGTAICKACKGVTYCGRMCQVQDWKMHKKSCKTLPPLPKHKLFRYRIGVKESIGRDRMLIARAEEVEITEEESEGWVKWFELAESDREYLTSL